MAIATNREASYDLERIKTFYPKVSAYLGVDNTETTLNFSRRQVPTPVINFQQAPNVVVILMESMAAHRVGVFGNPLEDMPRLDNMASSG